MERWCMYSRVPVRPCPRQCSVESRQPHGETGCQTVEFRFGEVGCRAINLDDESHRLLPNDQISKQLNAHQSHFSSPQSTVPCPLFPFKCRTRPHVRRRAAPHSFLDLARPAAAGPVVLAGVDRPRAGLASRCSGSLRRAAICCTGRTWRRMKPPHVFLRPIQQWVHFDEVELSVPLDDACRGPVRGLIIPADGAPPRPAAAVRLDGPAKRQHLAIVAALIGTMPIQRAAVLGFVLSAAVSSGPNAFDRDAVLRRRISSRTSSVSAN